MHKQWLYLSAYIMKKRLIFLLILPLSGLMACLDDPDCNSKTTDFINVQFFDLETKSASEVMVNSLTALNSDSTFLQDTTVTSIRLPLEPNVGLTTFAFNSEFGLDTLSFTYSNKSRLVSEECGIEIIYINLDTIRNDFDSLAIVNGAPEKVLSLEVTQDVEIYN